MWGTVATASAALPTVRSLSTSGSNDTGNESDNVLGTSIWDTVQTLLDPGTAIIGLVVLLVLAFLTPWIWRMANAAYQRRRR